MEFFIKTISKQEYDLLDEKAKTYYNALVVPVYPSESGLNVYSNKTVYTPVMVPLNTIVAFISDMIYNAIPVGEVSTLDLIKTIKEIKNKVENL